jgi:hypothetical protein
MASPYTDSDVPIDEELAAYNEQVDAICEAASALLAGLDDARFNWRPEAGAWSIAQCLGHLTLTGKAYLGPMEEAIAKAREEGLVGKGPFRYGLLEGLFVRAVEPPVRLKVIKSPSALTPPPEQSLEAGMNAFFRLQRRIVRALQQADGLHLARIKVPSPVKPLFTFSLGRCFAFLLAHERRHLEQAQRVRENPRFSTHE